MTDLKELARRCIAALTEAGAEQAQCEATVSEKKEFNVDGGAFSLFRTTFNHRLELTAYKDSKRGTVVINSFGEETVRRAVADCLSVTESGEADPAFAIAPPIGEREFVSGSPEPDTDRLFQRAEELLRQIGKQHPKVLIEQMIVSHNRAETVFADTSMNLYKEISGYYCVDLMFSAHEGEKSSSFLSTGYLTADLDQPFMECGSIPSSLAASEKQIHTVPVKGKFEGVAVFTPDCLGTMLSEIVGNFATGTNLINGTSIWRDMLGKQVADPSVTVSFRPHDPAIVCGERYTVDGYLSEDFDLIRNGILESFHIAAFASNKTGHPRSKNSSWSFVMPKGDRPLAELIGGIERGLLVGRFSGGSPATNGDFSGVAKNSFLIENGRITSAVSETMINGNLAQLLKNPVGFSEERIADGGTLLPYAAFAGVTVSGKEEA